MELKYEFLNKMNTLNSISKNNGYMNFRDWANKQNKKKLINSIEFDEIELFHNIRNIISHGAADRVVVYQSDVDKLDYYIRLLNKSLGYNETVIVNNYQENKQVIKKSNNVAHKTEIVAYIEKLKKEAKLKGLNEIVLLSAQIEKEVGLSQRIVSICSAMYECMRTGDEILHTVPSGYSTTVKIKYCL